MAKKRKTYYLDETTIQKVKKYARQHEMSENETFENALNVYEQFYEKADQFLTLPREYQPIILEAIDSMIYQSKQLLETTWPPPNDQKEAVTSSLSARIELLKQIKKRLDD